MRLKESFFLYFCFHSTSDRKSRKSLFASTINLVAILGQARAVRGGTIAKAHFLRQFIPRPIDVSPLLVRARRKKESFDPLSGMQFRDFIESLISSETTKRARSSINQLSFYDTLPSYQLC